MVLKNNSLHALALVTAAAIWWLAGLYLYLSPKLPEAEALQDIKLQTPLRILSADGQLIGRGVILLVGIVRLVARRDDRARLLQGSLERRRLAAERLRWDRVRISGAVNRGGVERPGAPASAEAVRGVRRGPNLGDAAKIAARDRGRCAPSRASTRPSAAPTARSGRRSPSFRAAVSDTGMGRAPRGWVGIECTEYPSTCGFLLTGTRCA